MTPEQVIKLALERVMTRLRSMQRNPKGWGHPEAVELQALLALEFRSMIGRPISYSTNTFEVRNLMREFIFSKTQCSNGPLFSFYENKESEFHKSLQEFITQALEKLPLETS